MYVNSNKKTLPQQSNLIAKEMKSAVVVWGGSWNGLWWTQGGDWTSEWHQISDDLVPIVLTCFYLTHKMASDCSVRLRSTDMFAQSLVCRALAAIYINICFVLQWISEASQQLVWTGGVQMPCFQMGSALYITKCFVLQWIQKRGWLPHRQMLCFTMNWAMVQDLVW